MVDLLSRENIDATSNWVAVGLFVGAFVVCACAFFDARVRAKEHLYAEEDRSAQETENAHLRDRAAQLEDINRDRDLTAAGATKLTAFLEAVRYSGPAIEVSAAMGSAESARYATKIRDAVQAAQWPVTGEVTQSIVHPIQSGISVMGGSRAVSAAAYLADKLYDGVFPINVRIDPNDVTDNLVIFVGLKPTPDEIAHVSVQNHTMTMPVQGMR